MTVPSPAKDFRSDSGFSSSGQRPHDTELSDISRANTVQWPQYVVELESIQKRVQELAGYVKRVGPLHQRALSSPASVQDDLNSTSSKIWSLNWRIRDAIREVELDAFRSSDADPFGSMRNKKLGLVIEAKNKFEHEMRIYQDEEIEFQERYREHIARQYHIINPDAGEAELRQAASADWSNDRVFKAAVNSSKNPDAQFVLSGVRERHEELKRIDASLRDLSVLFNDLAQTVSEQAEYSPQLERTPTQKSQGVVGGAAVSGGGAILTHFDEPARTERAHQRKKRRQLWCLFIIGLIILTILISAGTYFIVHGKYLPAKEEPPGGRPSPSPTSTESSSTSTSLPTPTSSGT